MTTIFADMYWYGQLSKNTFLKEIIWKEHGFSKVLQNIPLEKKSFVKQGWTSFSYLDIMFYLI